MTSDSKGSEHARAEHFLMSMAASIAGPRRGRSQEGGIEGSARRIAEFLAENEKEGNLETVLGVVEEALDQEIEFLRPTGILVKGSSGRPSKRRGPSEADPYYWG